MTQLTKSTGPNARRKARRLALQALYQWQLSNMLPADIEQQFLSDQPLSKVDVPYFLELLRGVPKNLALIDEKLTPVLDRPIAELNPVELAILRLGIYELTHRLDIPYRVIIDEALRLAKTFGAIEGFKYVNAVLDKIARSLRVVEVQMKRPTKR